MTGSWPPSVIFGVLMLLPSSTASICGVSRYAMMKVAIAFSMIVLITSLTPRVTFSSAAIPAQAAPTAIATISVMAIRRKPGSDDMKAAPATAAASIAASRYWPSTPMLNRFILKPMATATAAR